MIRVKSRAHYQFYVLGHGLREAIGKVDFESSPEPLGTNSFIHCSKILEVQKAYSGT